MPPQTLLTPPGQTRPPLLPIFLDVIPSPSPMPSEGRLQLPTYHTEIFPGYVAMCGDKSAGAYRILWPCHAMLAPLFDIAPAARRTRSWFSNFSSAPQVCYRSKDTERSETESEVQLPEANSRSQPESIEYVPETRMLCSCPSNSLRSKSSKDR